MGFIFNGKTYNIPGVVGLLKVIQLAGGQLPDFNIGLIIAKSKKGVPYNAANLKADELMLPYNDANALALDYGKGDIYEQFKTAQGQGAGTIFVLNASPNTQLTAIIQDATPADSLKFLATPMNFGIFAKDNTLSIVEGASDTRASGANTTGSPTSATNTTLVRTGAGWTVDAFIGKWVKITGGTGRGQTRKITDNDATSLTVATWTTNPDTTSTYEIVEPLFTVTITPTKEEKLLTQTANSGQNIIYVNNVEGIDAGRTFILASSARESITVKAVDKTYTANGYKVVLESNLSNNHTTGNTGRLFNKDTARQAVYTFVGSEYNLAAIVAKINAIPQFFTTEAVGTDVPATLAETYFSALSTVAGGANIDATSADYTEIATLFPSWSDAFLRANKVNVRIILLGTPDASIHAVFKALQATMRSNTYNRPISIVAGCELGDILVTGSATTNPIYRAASINDGSFSIWADGLDGLPAYKSLAPQIFGIRLANPITHNLTRDKINASKLEKEWTRPELEKLLVGGVGTVVATKTGFRVAQGISTYQDHTNDWNEQDNDTYLIQQRDLADYFHIGIIQGLDNDLVGNDNITLETVTQYVNATAQKYIQEGYITSIVVKEIKKSGLGWIVKHDITLPGLTDFFGVQTYIIAGGNA